ncbi:MAG: D-alanyl-D-alanine carboxypeptidase [Acetatifactor sp.]|nr:D-alanyl-D-alanine carboxypeptidase [Acetatifactor sp.]
MVELMAVGEVRGENGGENAREKAVAQLYSTAAVLMDADTGRVLYGKNADVSLPMASTTKIMTCILALELADPEETVTVSSYAAGQPKVHLGLKAWESYRMEDLLYSLMLESHNDSAVAIAEHIGKKLMEESGETTEEKTSREFVAAFADRMNEKARQLHCEQTYFITPNGLDAEERVEENGEVILRSHSTTAAELARIFAYCIRESPKSEDFLKITREPNYCFTANNRTFSLTNHNAFLQMMEGALSGKTGFTGKAGYCYVGALERDGKTFVVALLACGWPNHKTWKWKDTRELMNYGLDHYEYRDVDSDTVAKTKLLPIPVILGQTDRLGETAYVPVRVVFPVSEWREKILLSEEEEIRVSCTVSSHLTAPVSAGTKVGMMQVTVGEDVLFETDIETTASILRIDFEWCLSKIWNSFLLNG